jgi:lysophospholipase L1-like esterase
VFAVTAALLGLVAVLVVAEFLLRWAWRPAWLAEFQQAGMYVPTADGDIALRPGYRGTLQVVEPTTVSINALGMRGPELRPKAVGERRLLVLGDSMVWGYGVQAEQALPARLEHALREQGLVLAVGNGGVPGYGSKHVVQHQARLDAAFAPDAFVIAACLGNDSLDDTAPMRTVYADLQLQGPWARLAQQSARARLMYRSRLAMWCEATIATHWPAASLLAQLPFDPAEAALRAGLPAATTACLFLDAADPRTTWQEGVPGPLPRLLELQRTSLQAVRERAAARPLVFVVLPTRWHVIEPERQEQLRAQGLAPLRYPRGTAQQRWCELARELGLLALDATPILAAEPDPAGLFVDVGHFSARGHEVVARWLATAIAPQLR